jgi:hypothetical protein
MIRLIIQTKSNQIVIIKRSTVTEMQGILREKLRNSSFLVLMADDVERTFLIKVDEIISIDIHNV